MDKFFLSISLSIIIHVFILFGLSSFISTEKLSYSQKIGESQVKTTVNIVLQKKKQQKIIERLKSTKTNRKQKVTEKKKTEQLELNKTRKTDQGKRTDLAKYLSQVRSLIVKYKYMNRISKKLKLKGTVELSFNISWPNHLSNLKIIKPSKLNPLNDSALKGIQNIENLPKMPESLKSEILTARIAVIYE